MEMYNLTGNAVNIQFYERKQGYAMTRAEVGERIANLRMNQNMTREQVAQAAGLSIKFIYEVEKGRKGLSVDSLLKIANALSCSSDQILGEK